jgi:hypothetical protein
VPKSPASHVSTAAFGVAMPVNFVPTAPAVLAFGTAAGAAERPDIGYHPRANPGAFIERWRGRAGQ